MYRDHLEQGINCLATKFTILGSMSRLLSYEREVKIKEHYSTLVLLIMLFSCIFRLTFSLIYPNFSSLSNAQGEFCWLIRQDPGMSIQIQLSYLLLMNQGQAGLKTNERQTFVKILRKIVYKSHPCFSTVSKIITFIKQRVVSYIECIC